MCVRQRRRPSVIRFVLFCFMATSGWLMACEEQGKLPRRAIPVPASPQALQGRQSRMIRSSKSLRTASGNSVAGIKWRIPKGWGQGRKSRMRTATYIVPGGGECAVFHFGPNGGSTQANIDRWRKQFRNGKVKLDTKYVGGVKVTMVYINGTFMKAARPMSPQKTAMPNYKMLGAIVLAPRGPVFFKCVGPTTPMDNANGAFRGMLFSIKKGR